MSFGSALLLIANTHIFTKCFYFAFVLTQGFWDISTLPFKKPEDWTAIRLQHQEFKLFFSGLTSRTRTHQRPPKYHAPFATGTSPSNETFWLCLPILLLGNPWVACSYSVVFCSPSPSPCSLALLLETHQYRSAEKKTPTTTLRG